MKEIKKRIFSFVLALAMVVTVFPPIQAFAIGKIPTTIGSYDVTLSKPESQWLHIEEDIWCSFGCYNNTTSIALKGTNANPQIYHNNQLVSLPDPATETTIECGNCGAKITFTPKSSHTHDWSYSADGTTLTASCSGKATCGQADVTLTLTASSANYSGRPAEITIGTTGEITAWEGAGLTVPADISYETSTGTDLGTTAPTTVGSYVAKVSPVGETASATNTAKVSYTIIPAPGTFADLFANLKTDGTLVKLTKDYQRGAGEDGINISSGKVNIDLNGHTIDGANDTGTNAYIFQIAEGCELTISDSSNGNGVITGGTGYKTESASYGGAIFNYGTVTINDGTFTGNLTNNGGAISNNGGTVTINGGIFTGNGKSSTSGGTISSSGKLTITGGTFTGNSGYSGGAVYNSTTGNLTITGGTFTDNTATYGGAISNSGSLTVTGGTFTDNTANSDGGAIDNYKGSICIGGSVVVKDNKKGSATNNVELETGTTLTLTAFSTTAEVGLTINGAKEPLISEGVNLSVLSHIKSDNNTKMFVVNNGALKSETKASHVHSGGSATCQTQGTCQTCGQSYYGEHNYGYSATGNILKYACQTSGCTEGVTLTLSASDATYSGNAVTAGFDSDEAAAWKAATGENAPNITYEAKSGSALTSEKAVNVGSYTAKATVTVGQNTYTATKDFEIVPAPIQGSNIAWDFNSTTGTLTISGTGAMPDFEYYYEAPWYSNSITSVVIGDKVTSIGDMAFAQTAITEITIPDSVTSIGIASFFECESLTSATLGKGLKTIGEYAFKETGLTSIVIPDSVKTIGEQAFYKCLSLTSATFGENVETIGSDAFENTKLTEITIPASVTEINGCAFGYSYNVVDGDYAVVPFTIKGHGLDSKAYQYFVAKKASGWKYINLDAAPTTVGSEFAVSGKDASLTYITGKAEESTLHIDGIELADVYQTVAASNVYEGIYVTCDGEEVVREGNYEVKEGSVKVIFTDTFLNSLSVGEHTIKTYINGTEAAAADKYDYVFNTVITVKAKPSTGGGSTTPTTTPTYKVPNTSVGQDINPMNKTIGLLSIALVAGCIARKKKED